MDIDIELIGAKEASRLLGTNPNTIYNLWNKQQLSWWSINGTKKTTRRAISDFLERTQFMDLKAMLSNQQ